jgi:hypothetical protein
MAATKLNQRELKQRKFKRPTLLQEKFIRSGYVAGFLEALRLQNGMPSGVTSRKTWSDRTKWALRSFETDRARRMAVGKEVESINRTKSGAPPDLKFIARLAKSYLPEKFVHISVPAQERANVT